MVISEALVKSAAPRLLFSFTPIGLVMPGISLRTCSPFSRVLSHRKRTEEANANKRKSLNELADEYQLPAT